MNRDDRWDDEVRDAYHRPIEGEEQARARAIGRLRRESAARPSRVGAWWADPDAHTLAPGAHGENLAAARALEVLSRRLLDRAAPVQMG